MLWSLFMIFFKMGCISFGGGYTMIPLIQQEAVAHQWMSEQEFMDTVALAGMGPGPIAINIASLVGYHAAGIQGAVTAAAGIVLPSLMVIIALAACFYKLHENLWVKSSLYGLRPIISALIVYASLHMIATVANGQYLSWSTLATLGIAAAAIIAIVRYRVNPFLIIIASGLLGIILF